MPRSLVSDQAPPSRRPAPGRPLNGTVVKRKGTAQPDAVPVSAATATTRPTWEVARKTRSRGQAEQHEPLLSLRKGARYVALNAAAMRLLSGISPGQELPRSVSVVVLFDRTLHLIGFRVATQGDPFSQKFKLSRHTAQTRWKAAIGNAMQEIGIPADHPPQADITLHRYSDGAIGCSLEVPR